MNRWTDKLQRKKGARGDRERKAQGRGGEDRREEERRREEGRG